MTYPNLFNASPASAANAAGFFGAVKVVLTCVAGIAASGSVWAQSSAASTPQDGAAVAHPDLLWLCAVLFAAVFLAMLVAIWRHRRKVKQGGGRMGEPGWVELCWTLIPMLIIVGAAWPVFRALTL